MPHEAEGVIKYRLEFTPGPPQGIDVLSELIGWQQILHTLGLLGRDSTRYGGLAYGNVSRRLPDGGFVISASQTGDLARPTPADYAVVRHWDCAGNHVSASGPAKPSSESLTHAALYDADPAIACVLHVHVPLVWQRRDRLGVASTAADVAYGTPAMAAEVTRLYRECGFAAQGILAMAGHTDGIVSFGPDPDQAGLPLIRLLRRALSAAATGG